MHVTFNEPSAAQIGRGLDVYRGLDVQRGSGGLGSVLGKVFRFLLPIGTAIGKQTLKGAIGAVSDIAKGDSPKTVMKRRSRQVGRKAVKKGFKAMRGRGVGTPPGQKRTLKPIYRSKAGPKRTSKKRKSGRKPKGLWN